MKTRFARAAGALLVGGLMLTATPAAAGAATAPRAAAVAPQAAIRIATERTVMKDPWACQRESAWISYGSWSECVGTLQVTLDVLYGENLAIDWSYGPATTAAVYRFQARYGLTYDGKCGPQTWDELCWRWYLYSHGRAY